MSEPKRWVQKTDLATYVLYFRDGKLFCDQDPTPHGAHLEGLVAETIELTSAREIQGLWLPVVLKNVAIAALESGQLP